jgi:hypothetical protein
MKAEKKVFSGSVLLKPSERDALKACAQNCSRRMSEQMRWYIIDGLRRDGYLTTEV